MSPELQAYLLLETAARLLESSEDLQEDVYSAMDRLWRAFTSAERADIRTQGHRTTLKVEQAVIGPFDSERSYVLNALALSQIVLPHLTRLFSWVDGLRNWNEPTGEDAENWDGKPCCEEWG